MSFTEDFLAVREALRRLSPVVLHAPPAIRMVLLKQYVEMSMRNARLSLASFGLLLFGLSYEAPLLPRLGAWALLAAIYGLRLWRSRLMIRRLDPQEPRSDHWYDALTLLASSAWCVAPFLLKGWVSELNLFGAVYSAFVAASLLAVTYLSALPASVVLVAFSVLPLVAFMLLHGSVVLAVLAVGTLVCAVALLQRVSSGHATLLKALAAERENLALVRELEGYRQQLENENAALGSSLRDASLAATRDPLTGLFNRRHITAFVQPVAERIRSGAEHVTLCMVDVDHFKAVNDRHGHRVGDEMLRAVGALLGARLRDVDCLARVGGEEFMAVLRDCDSSRGHRVAESLRHQVAMAAISTTAGELSVTVSIGVAQWRADEAFDDVVERADQALYEAKRGGRNRVEFGEAWPPTAPVGLVSSPPLP
jgi:diguanylate cyclase (GGDEF)-like protein